MKTLSTIALFCGAVLLSSCTKEGPEGPAGPQGPQGNANVGRYEFTLPFSSYTNFTTTNAWGASAPSTVPQLQSNQLALVYISLTPAISGLAEWVQQPFSYFFGSGNTFVECFHSIDSGTLWLYARHSGGTQPFTTSSNLSYKVFIVQSSMMQVLDDENVDMRNLGEFESFLDRHGYEHAGYSASH
ncbi:MAG: hypothetical protein KF905_16030 [Flavobacteriales bacterium]|nr:hypothetical protein [Flavobacteriales bacterium]